MGTKNQKNNVSKVMNYSSWQTTDLHEIEVKKTSAGSVIEKKIH